MKQHQRERERERKVEGNEGFKSWVLFIAALVFAWKGAPLGQTERETDNEGVAKWQMV